MSNIAEKVTKEILSIVQSNETFIEFDWNSNLMCLSYNLGFEGREYKYDKTIVDLHNGNKHHLYKEVSDPISNTIVSKSEVPNYDYVKEMLDSYLNKVFHKEFISLISSVIKDSPYTADEKLAIKKSLRGDD